MTRKIRVAVLINDLYLNTLEPLFRSLSSDPRFIVRVWACRRIGYEFAPEVGSQKVSELLGSHAIPHRLDPTREDLLIFSPDFVFTSNPYDMYLDSDLSSDWLSTHSRLMHISYGAALIEWAGEYEFLSRNPFMDRAHRVYIESPLIHRDRENFVPTGYAKLTEYVDGTRHPKTFPRRSIAWKPRWTKHEEPKLLKLIEVFRSLSRRHIINLVVHPMLIKNNEGPAGAAISALASIEGVNEVSGHDFLDYVLGSDMYVGDISSTLAEFTWTGRPVIYTGEIAGLNNLGSKIIDASYHSDADSLERIIFSLEQGDDPLSAKRTGLFARVFPSSVNGPIEAIKGDIELARFV